MIILVDQDDVLADFNGGFKKLLNKSYPEAEFVPSYRLVGQYFEKYGCEIRDAVRRPGFIRGLKPIDGAINALCEMDELCDVFICTSSMNNYNICISEKMEWINTYLGKEWLKKIIVTKDKTLVSGDYLIDDKPEITGVRKPDWEHILYSQSYNEHVEYKKRLTWNNWKEILEI